jgi:hypothetical protein
MNERIRVRALSALAIALLIGTTLYAQLPCGDCQPAVKPNFSPGSVFKVVLDPGLSQNEIDMTMKAIDAWNQWAYDQGLSGFISIGYNEWYTMVTVKEDPQMANDPYTGATFNNSTFEISINPLYGGRNDDFFAQIMIHEMGHAVGFADVGGNCQGKTVMYGSINPGQGPYVTSLTDTDKCAMTYNRQGDPDPNYGTDPGWQPADGWWCPTCSDPLVLDLNGDGVNTTGSDDPVWFDLAGIGKRIHTTWTNARTEEAFLWVNLTGKHNRVEDGTELFGIGTTLPDGSKAKDGFEALAMYDRPDMGGNGDGVIDAQDWVFTRLRLWIDRNHDGVCDPTEVETLAQNGVEAILLTSIRSNVADAQGNVHSRSGVYFRTEHGKRKIYAVDSVSFKLVP